MAKEPIRPVTLADGTKRWRLVVDIGNDPVTKKRRQLTSTWDTQKAARAELNRIRHESNTGAYIRPAKTTLSEYLDTWLAGRRKLEAATRSNYENALKPARERLGTRELQSITKGDIDGLVEWMLSSGRKRGGKPGTGVSPRAVQLTLTALQMALDMAVGEKKLSYNPTRLVERPTQIKTKRTPWTVDEIRAFLAAIRDDRLFAVMFLSLMGLRPEEVCGLKWDKVDLENGALTIDWVRTLVDGQAVEKEPKSEAGVRPLPLPAAPSAALKKLKTRQAAEKLAAGEAYGKDDKGRAYSGGGYVLADELGQPWKTDQLRRRFYRLVELAGVRKVRLYDARHACLTYLAVNGVPDVIVSTWAGHADLSFTKRTYVHPAAEELRAGSDALDRLFS